MAIKDSIVNLKKGLRTTLTNAPAIIDTLIRGLDGVEEEIEKGKVYNTSEKVIGTWIDGSEIYEKTIDLSNCSKSSVSPTDLGINPGAVISTTLSGIYKLSGTDFIITSEQLYLSNTTPTENFNIYIRKETTLKCFWQGSGTLTELHMIIRYTKTSASRSPEENNTKNNGDEEKNDEEVKTEK